MLIISQKSKLMYGNYEIFHCMNFYDELKKYI